jgi:hypothetical protein
LHWRAVSWELCVYFFRPLRGLLLQIVVRNLHRGFNPRRFVAAPGYRRSRALWLKKNNVCRDSSQWNCLLSACTVRRDSLCFDGRWRFDVLKCGLHRSLTTVTPFIRRKYFSGVLDFV